MNTLPIVAILVALSGTLGCALPSGLLRSRWAMADPEYAEKYSEGAEKSDIVGKVKQASDARFVEDHTGLYASLGGASWGKRSQAMLAGEIGMEHYMTSAWTIRGGLAAFANQTDEFVGAELGTRLQAPTRLAPYVGAGTFAGYSEREVPQPYPRPGDEPDTEFSGAVVSIYPETGVHFWWNPYVRLSASGRYVVSSSGRHTDDWLIGGGLAIFAR